MRYINEEPPQIFRTLFLSDFHIGAKTFNAEALLDFLRKTESHTLYLVGDIIDGWKLHKRWFWTETVSEIFDELFRKASEGTRIIYITGNHDEAIRDLSFFNRMRYAARLNIQIKNRVIHRMADGRDFLIMHGDQFDRAILRGRLSRWSDRLYDALTQRKGPTIDINGTTKRFSLSKFLSYHGQIALNLLNNYERALCREARRSDVEGIVCGHTHIPAHKKIGSITYANCGSWLKNCQTAIAECEDGSLSLIEWGFKPQEEKPLLPFYNGDIEPVRLTPDAYRFRPKTLRLIASIRRAWPSPHDASEKTKRRFILNFRPFYAQ